MNVVDFKQRVEQGVTMVIVPFSDWDMPQGWEDRMDDMVGIPLLVLEKGPQHVVLEHPDGDGERYSFGYKNIMLEHVRKVRVQLRDYNLKVNEKINSVHLLRCLLAKDIEVLSSIPGIYTNEPDLTITSELLEEIQKQCPRVIGAMLSNNLLEREY